MRGQMPGDPAGPADVLRIAVVVGLDLARDARIRGAVDLVRRGVQGGQTAGDQNGRQPFGRGGEIAGGAESAEALAEHGPGGAAGQSLPDVLAVADDRIGAEVRQIVGLLARSAAQRQGLPVGRGGEAGAALVEEEHPEFLERPAQPGLPADEPAGAEAGTALQVHQPRQIRVRLGTGDGLACVQLDPLPRRVGVIQRNVEVVVGEDDAGLAIAGQECSCSRSPPSGRPCGDSSAHGPATGGTRPAPHEWIRTGRVTRSAPVPLRSPGVAGVVRRVLGRSRSVCAGSGTLLA